jgi:hypothetical protein
MPCKIKDKQKLLNMKLGDTVYVNWFEEGGAQVVRHLQHYELSEISQYGGYEHPYGVFPLGQEDKLIEIAYSWS